jgi:hypothetical protein
MVLKLEVNHSAARQLAAGIAATLCPVTHHGLKGKRRTDHITPDRFKF